jgi:CheY-like chemotaxis protein
MFADTHHRLFLAAGGREAVEKARQLRPDIVLLDIRMPDMDGCEVLEAIRKIPGLELTPVIAITASALLNEENSLRSQFSGYVRKPFTQQDIFDQLAQFLPAPAKKANTVPMPAAADTAKRETVVPQEVLSEVQRLMDSEWPSVRDSVAINESKAFASKLDVLGRRWSCQPLISYAGTLRRYAESYAVVELENTLNQFSSVSRELHRQATHAG